MRGPGGGRTLRCKGDGARRLGARVEVKRGEEDPRMTPRRHVGQRIQEERGEVQSRVQPGQRTPLGHVEI